MEKMKEVRKYLRLTNLKNKKEDQTGIHLVSRETFFAKLDDHSKWHDVLATFQETSQYLKVMITMTIVTAIQYALQEKHIGEKWESELIDGVEKPYRINDGVRVEYDNHYLKCVDIRGITDEDQKLTLIMQVLLATNVVQVLAYCILISHIKYITEKRFK